MHNLAGLACRGREGEGGGVKRVWAFWVVVCLGLGCGAVEEVPEPEDTPTSLEEQSVQLPEMWKAQGATRWLRSVRDSVIGLTVTVDRRDNAFVSVSYESQHADLGGGPLPGGVGIGLAKYAPDGRHLWSRAFPMSGEVVPHVLASTTDEAGNLYIVGEHSGEAMSLGGAPLPAGTFVAKYAPDGRHLWSRTWEHAGLPVSPAGLVVDERTGHVVLAGNPEESPEVPVGAIIARMRMDDGSGSFVRALAVSGEPVVTGIALDPSGRIAVVGNYSGTVDLGGGPLHTPLSRTPFVARYSTEVLHLWSRSLDGAEGSATGVAATGSRIVVVGNYSGSFRFRGRAQPAADEQDAFLATYEATGEERWVRHFGQSARAVGVDHHNRVVVVGQYRPGDSAGGARLPFHAADDFEDNHVFVAKFDRSSGAHTWSRGLFATVVLRVRDFALTRGGEAGLICNFESTADFGTGPVTVSTDSAVILRLGP
jgi:hypothetical protein